MQRETQKVLFATADVTVVRCTPADYLPLADWSDMHLGRDYFFRRGHIEKVLQREHNEVWAVLIEGKMSGLVILYKGSVLHNFYLAPEHRKGGIGSAILQHFHPTRIRSKTNMLAGDPTPFYEKNGYVRDVPDPERPHIIDMVRPVANGTYPGASSAPGANTLPDTICATSAEPFEMTPPTAEPIAARLAPPASGQAGPAASFAFDSSAGQWAADGGVAELPAAAPLVPVAPSVPLIPPATAAGAKLVLVDEAELRHLRKAQNTRERVKRYRERKKAQAVTPPPGRSKNVEQFEATMMARNGTH